MALIAKPKQTSNILQQFSRVTTEHGPLTIQPTPTTVFQTKMSTVKY